MEIKSQQLSNELPYVSLLDNKEELPEVSMLDKNKQGMNFTSFVQKQDDYYS